MAANTPRPLDDVTITAYVTNTAAALEYKADMLEEIREDLHDQIRTLRDEARSLRDADRDDLNIEAEIRKALTGDPAATLETVRRMAESETLQQQAGDPAPGTMQAMRADAGTGDPAAPEKARPHTIHRETYAALLKRADPITAAAAQLMVSRGEWTLCG